MYNGIIATIKKGDVMSFVEKKCMQLDNIFLKNKMEARGAGDPCL